MTNAPETVPTEQNSTNMDTAKNNQNPTNTTNTTSFNFSEFSLDVDYSATESYEVEYDNEATGVEASIDDGRSNLKVTGNDAYTQLEPLFQELDFDKTTLDEDVIDEVLTVFGITDEYQSVEIDVRFADGTEKEYRATK